MTPVEANDVIKTVYETLFLVLAGFGLGYQVRRYFEERKK